MRFDIHLRTQIKDQIDVLAETMKSWEGQSRVTQREKQSIREKLSFFNHSTVSEKLQVGGVDGTGDFPALSYGDSFVYVAVAQGAIYENNPVSGLKEVAPLLDPVVHFTWLPENATIRVAALDEAFSELMGMSVEQVIEWSDYRYLKSKFSRTKPTITDLKEHLIRPHASDAGNIGLQLRSTAELGAALMVINGVNNTDYVLMDGTLSLPLVGTADASLFYEHAKRLCCVIARDKGIGFFALSKSHGLVSIEFLEEIAREQQGLEKTQSAEHWYLKLPTPGIDDWSLSLTEGRRLPPPGVVTYLVRFHRTTPVMRLDVDIEFWNQHIKGSTPAETKTNEQRIFEDLDYTCHDQRCYGYPYPIKACHDRASLTKAERIALRKQIIDAAVKAGLKRTLFRNASQATGHG